MSLVPPPAILVDRHNVDVFLPILLERLRTANALCGFDIETEDSQRHAGLNKFMGATEETRGSKKKLVFDIHRTVMTGFSVYVDGDSCSYYFNLAHADKENRILDPRACVKAILEANSGTWLAHNLAFEIVMTRHTQGLEFPKTAICTLQACVSAYGPDEYDLDDFHKANFFAVEKLMPSIDVLSASWAEHEKDIPDDLNEVINQITGKQSRAAFSYNGFVSQFNWGYGLKQVVERHFGYKMQTFDEVLGEHGHMGQLTGAEVVSYGCDDAFWVVPLFKRTLEIFQERSPNAITAFLETEAPMVFVYADIWSQGIQINPEGVRAIAQVEKARAAEAVRSLQKSLRSFLPFPAALCEGLKSEKWYKPIYRNKIERFCETDMEGMSDEDVLSQISGPIPKMFDCPVGEINLTHYMVVRTIIYDLLGARIIRSEGKVQSDADARGRIEVRFSREGSTSKVELMSLLTELAGVDQRVKLYLNPYLQLVDPDTGRLHPQIGSDKATRRMGMTSPNANQLGKRGESVYIRGFYEADDEDSLVISLDWSAFELVIIGEQSGDKNFVKCYAQRPHLDLHAGAAADILSVSVPGLTEDAFNLLKSATSWEHYQELTNLDDIRRLKRSLKQETLEPSKARGYWRTEIGKGANFNYWYSGWLSTVGERMGLSQDQTAEATERYRARFPEAEEWRLNIQREGAIKGWTELPDGHRRWKWEATEDWHNAFWPKIPSLHQGVDRVKREIIKRIQRRAKNQLVNARVQGTNAFIAKRTILRLLSDPYFPARLMMPVHDELVFSCHKSQAYDVIQTIWTAMVDHLDVFKLTKLDATASFGFNYEPWHPTKQLLGQIEMHEAPAAEFVRPETVGKTMSREEVEESIRWLSSTRARLRS